MKYYNNYKTPIMKCFKIGCKTEPNLYCCCEKKVIYTCSLHLTEHLVTKNPKPHKFISPSKPIPPDNKSSVINILKETIENLKTFKKGLIESFESLSQSLIKSIEKIDKLIKLYNKSLKESLIQNQITFIVSLNKKYNQSDTDASLIALNVKEQTKRMNFYKISEKVTSIIDNISRFTYEQKSKLLPYFIERTKNFVLFDTYNHSFMIKNLENIESQGRRGTLCYLNNHEIFCYGGENENKIRKSFIIDTSNFCVRHLPNGRPRHSARSVKADHKIFVFGGWAYTSLKNSDCFELKHNYWRSISDLPSHQSDTSTIKIKNKILITGCYNFLQIYNISTDSYKDLLSDFKVDRYNIVIKYGKYVYLLCEYIFYSKKDKLKYWTRIPDKLLKFDMNSCIPVIRDNCAFFIDEKYDIYVLEFKDMRLSLLCNGKYSQVKEARQVSQDEFKLNLNN